MAANTIILDEISDDLLLMLDLRVKETCASDRATYIRGLIQKDAASVSTPPLSKAVLDELLAPVRADFKANPMTLEELDAFIEEAREEAYQERQKRKVK